MTLGPRSRQLLVAALVATGCARPPARAEAPPAAASASSARVPDPPVATTVAPIASTAAPAVSAAPAAAAVVVRFVCDEKYTGNACDEARWRSSVVRSPGPTNLLDHHDGGPSGAIWNGDAPMVVLVTKPGRHSAKFGSAELTEQVFDGASWFNVPTAVWQRELRPVAGNPYRRAVLMVDGKPAGEIWRAEGE